jgi:hypothetical protein
MLAYRLELRGQLLGEPRFGLFDRRGVVRELDAPQLLSRTAARGA